MPDLSIKRMVDVAIAGTALVITAPLLGVLAAAVRVDSSGPALFRQARVGRNREIIQTLKLRTMVSNASRVGPSVTAAQDPRVTRVGRWLRKTKLDELPQLWNVLRGDMSLVGPRPEVPSYVETYRPEWLTVFEVRPGITDLASLTFRDEESILASANDRDRAYREVVMPAKLDLAVESVKASSLGFDFRIMLKTFGALVGVKDPESRRIVESVQRRIEQLNRTEEV